MWTRGLVMVLLWGVLAASEAPATTLESAPAMTSVPAPAEPFMPDSVWAPQPTAARGQPVEVGTAAGRMAVTLVLVLVGAGVALWALRAWLRRVGIAAGGPARRLQLLETLPLGNRRSLALVRIGRQVLVIGHGEGGVSHVATVQDEIPTPAVPGPLVPEAVPAAPAVPESTSALSRFEQRLRQVLGKAGP